MSACAKFPHVAHHVTSLHHGISVDLARGSIYIIYEPYLATVLAPNLVTKLGILAPGLVP